MPTQHKCPSCAHDTAHRIQFTPWGGVIGPRLLSLVKCGACGMQYNGKSGRRVEKAIRVYTTAAMLGGIGAAGGADDLFLLGRRVAGEGAGAAWGAGGGCFVTSARGGWPTGGVGPTMKRAPRVLRGSRGCLHNYAWSGVRSRRRRRRWRRPEGRVGRGRGGSGRRRRWRRAGCRGRRRCRPVRGGHWRWRRPVR